MINKRILVLANSTKHHPMRCVAGRELIDEGGGKSGWSGWIRPVSSPKKQQRGLFNYKGRHYDLALTDPLISQKYFPDYPRTVEGYFVRAGAAGRTIQAWKLNYTPLASRRSQPASFSLRSRMQACSGWLTFD